MNLKKSLIIGASVLALAPFASATFVGTQVQANEVDSVSVSQNGDIDIQKLDAYVSFDENNMEYKISDDAKDDLTESELQYLQTKVSETNITTRSIELSENESIDFKDNAVEVTQNIDSGGTTLRAASYKEGINQVKVYWWGVRVWLSKTTVNTIGAGITIGGIWIPEPFVSKVLATVGAVIGISPGGVVFNSSPHLAQLVPGNLGSGLNFWGFSFQ